MEAKRDKIFSKFFDFRPVRARQNKDIGDSGNRCILFMHPLRRDKNR
jgi:hypothetical protein